MPKARPIPGPLSARGSRAAGEKAKDENGGEEIFHAVIGTAGHIDHGKSVLVQALTGIHPDRLKEERERGITIDLGFAPLLLSNGLRVGIIDVPGHERFVKNMVAGATGIDFVLLVVAADDGVMAQTREHFQIVRLLGVPKGLVAITKIDLVEPAFVELVQEEVRELSRGSCLEGRPIVPVSAKTGTGLPELRAALERELAGLKGHPASGPFRMPIQRVFAKEGHGTVITGVPLSGRVALGETVEIQPPGFRGRVKGLQAYMRKIAHGQAGHSQALNVTGIERRRVTRGMVAATPEVFQPTRLVCAHLQHLPDAPYPLKHRAPVRFHAGTAEILGKVLLLEGDRLPPGGEGCVQLLLEEAALVCPGDRYILRHQSPVVTLGGGAILDNVPLKRKRGDEQVLAELAARRAALGDPPRLLAHVLDYAPGPKSVRALGAELGLLPEQVRALASELEKEERLVVLKPGETFMGAKVFAAQSGALRQCLEEFFQAHPALGGIEKPELKRRLEKARRRREPDTRAYFDELLAALEQRGMIGLQGNEVALAGRERKLDERWAGHARRVEAALRNGGLAPPLPAELEQQAGVPGAALKEVLRYLADTGQAVETGPALYFHRAVFDEAVAKVRALFAHTPGLTVSEIRKELGMNRKYVVPLVECFDRKGLTLREGDRRRWIAESP